MSEIPVHPRPRRLVDWINPTGAKKFHSLIDKVYQRKNLEMAWETVQANRGSGGVDGQSLEGFAAQLDPQLDRLQSELKENVYQPQPVRQVQIPKAGKPGEFRMLGKRTEKSAISAAPEMSCQPYAWRTGVGEKHGVVGSEIAKRRHQELRTYGFDPRSFFDVVLEKVVERARGGRPLAQASTFLKQAGRYGPKRLRNPDEEGKSEYRR